MSVLGRFRSHLEPGMRRTALRLSGKSVARAYALQSPNLLAAYLRNASVAGVPERDLTISIDGLHAAEPTFAEWIDPASGRTIRRVQWRPSTVLEVPRFDVDVALLVGHGKS